MKKAEIKKYQNVIDFAMNIIQAKIDDSKPYRGIEEIDHYCYFLEQKICDLDELRQKLERN